jgi:hypothetical protein
MREHWILAVSQCLAPLESLGPDVDVDSMEFRLSSGIVHHPSPPTHTVYAGTRQ